MIYSIILLLIISSLTIDVDGNMIDTLSSKSAALANRIDELTQQIAENALGRRRILTTNELQIIDKQALLDLHNQLRSQMANGQAVSASRQYHAKAADMNELLWDEGLATFATDYTAKCSGDDSGDDYPLNGYTPSFVPPNNADGSWGHGENLWYSPATSVTLDDLTAAVQSWFNENSNWMYGQYETSDYCKSGTMCHHFTQMIWAKTRYVGCGFHICPNGLISKSSQHTWFSCEYWPSGNNNNGYPYTKGEPSSKCDGDREPSTKYPGLCGGGVNTNFVMNGNTVINQCDDGLGRLISDTCSNNNNQFDTSITTPAPLSMAQLNVCSPRGGYCDLSNPGLCCSGRCDNDRNRCN